jgi:hypothetical protein
MPRVSQKGEQCFVVAYVDGRGVRQLDLHVFDDFHFIWLTVSGRVFIFIFCLVGQPTFLSFPGQRPSNRRSADLAPEQPLCDMQCQKAAGERAIVSLKSYPSFDETLEMLLRTAEAGPNA